MARRVAICLYWMWRQQRDHEQLVKSSVRTRDSPEIAMVCRKHREIDWASRFPFVWSLY